MFNFAIPSESSSMIVPTPHIADDRVSVASVTTSAPRRRRNNVGPVRGHNRFEARGKLICKHCRKRKWACEYASVDEPCQFCIERHLSCEKVWGEKRTRRMRNLSDADTATITPSVVDNGPVLMNEADVGHVGTLLVGTNVSETYDANPFYQSFFADPSLGVSSFPVETIATADFGLAGPDFAFHDLTGDIFNVASDVFTPVFLRFPRSPEPLIATPNLFLQDAHYFQYLYYTILPSRWSIAGTIFRFLWRTYGITFSNPGSSDLLRSSVLASAVVGKSYQTGQDVPQPEYNRYLNHFRSALNQAINENNFDETHLLALYFVIGNARAESNHAEFEKYLDYFCRLMGHLNQQAKNSGHQFPLQHIWRLLLSYLRRGYVYSSGTPLSIRKKDVQFLAMHDLDMQLTSNRNLGGDVNGFVGSSYYSGEERCRRLSRGWDVWDILSSLKAKFRASYYHQSETTGLETNLLFGKFLESIRDGTDGFERFKYLKKAFEHVTEPGFEETSRIEELFVASYIHLHAILSLLEFIVQGKAAQLPNKILFVLSSKKPSMRPDDDMTFLLPTLFSLTLAREVSGYSYRALQDLSSSETCNKCVAFAGFQRKPHPSAQCAHRKAQEMISYIDAYQTTPLERKAYIKLILEHAWFWGLSTCQDMTAACHWAVLGIDLENPTANGNGESN